MAKIQGADHEINFWKEFVKTERFLGGWVGQGKTPELNNIVYDFIKNNLPFGGKVLDCGSGVCSILNGTVPNKDLMVTDLLGAEYGKIFDYSKHDIVQPIPLGCEDLPYREQFDIVHISNALDHTQQPNIAFQKLLEAVKKDGYLIVQGFENEANHEQWAGFHQFNISLDHKDLVIQGKNDAWVFGTDLYEVVIAERIFIEMLGREWFIFIVKK